MAKINPIELQKHLKGVDYPVSKRDLLKHVEGEKLDEQMRGALEQLPEREFKNPAEISKAIGEQG